MPHPIPDPALPATQWAALLAHGVPTLFLVAALWAGRRRLDLSRAWRGAARATSAALLLAGAGLVLGLWNWSTGGVGLHGDLPTADQGVAGPAALSAGSTPTGSAGGAWQVAWSAVLLLVAFIGWVLARYAATYLQGEPRQHRFIRWFLLTLAGSSLVVSTDHLLVLVLAWLGTSLALQQLLTFYGNRPAAQMAAHKKFLVSRAADGCVLLAAMLLWRAHGTLWIPELLRSLQAAIAADGGPAADVVIAALLLAAGALLKSAQLPFHGWLMQVMEAPTPVSALLHAGVVNLGGAVLIRLAPLVNAVPAAQALLVLVGGCTAALAALVMTTRVSIKVSLAWSTCAQMGFMLLQCGLGLYEMALLHLLAHSLYKAHAFLAAGTTVHRTLLKEMAPAEAPVPLQRRWLAGLLACGLVAVTVAVAGVDVAAEPGLVAMLLVVALAVVPLVAAAGRPLPRQVGAAAVVIALYLGLHHVLHGLLPTPHAGQGSAHPTLDWLLAGWTALCFALLFVAQNLSTATRSTRWTQRLHAWCHAGLFLDERFTRFTLRLWPNRTGALR